MNHRGVVLLSLASTLALCIGTARPGVAEVRITIHHDSLSQTPSGMIKLKYGELMHVDIVSTSIRCFEFNAAVVQPPSGQKAPQAADQKEPFTDSVPWDIVHDGVSRDYTFEAIPRKGVTGCDGRSAHKWTISVQTDGWTLAFAGGFTADELTNPVFSLESGTMTTSSGSQTGSFVRRDRKAQDSFALGAAAMVHLYYSDPDWARFLRMNWVPVSFGLGINNGSNTRYFIGTGLRFDSKLFFVGGVAIGSVSRLPNGIVQDGFTTNSNALATLGSQTKANLFFALSYSFIDTGVSRFQSPFKENAAPSPSTPASSGGTTPAAASADLSVKATGSAGHYQVLVNNKGPNDVVGATISVDISAGLSNVTWTCQPDTKAHCIGNGTGKIADSIDLPSGTKVVYDITGTKGGSVVVKASIAAPANVTDPDLSNNESTVTD